MKKVNSLPKNGIQTCLELMVFLGAEILHYDDKEKTQCEMYKWFFWKKNTCHILKEKKSKMYNHI
jgi:hypothetical protein